MIEFYRPNLTQVHDMKCFMMLGWLMWPEMCRPSLCVRWGNILFLSHDIYMTFYESISVHKCSEHLSWFRRPTVSTIHIIRLCTLLLCKHAQEILNRSRNVFSADFSALADKECHVSPLFSTLEFDFGSSLSPWLTDERAIRLYQKVQPDSLIWQSSSNQMYSLFLALHQLDKLKSGKQKGKKIGINIMISFFLWKIHKNTFKHWN